MPREENRMNAQTRAGMFRRKVAKPRTTFANLGKGEIFSLPNSETRNAKTAAMAVEDMARAKVTTTLERMPGIFSPAGRAGGKKSSVRKLQKASPLAKRLMGLNWVKTVAAAKSATAMTNTQVYSFFCSCAIKGILFAFIRRTSNHQVFTAGAVNLLNLLLGQLLGRAVKDDLPFGQADNPGGIL